MNGHARAVQAARARLREAELRKDETERAKLMAGIAAMKRNFRNKRSQLRER